jgi:hypothetical protein
MNIIIITTKDYHLFANCNKWDKLDCSSFKHYLFGLLSSKEQSNVIIQKFYAKEPRMARYWVSPSRVIPELKILKREFGDDTIVCVMPSIPIYHIESERDGALRMSPKQCQDYVAAIVSSSIEELKTDFDNNIIILAHDRDLGIKANRVMRERDRVEGSGLDTFIKNGQLSLDNIFGFQHEKDMATYDTISKLIGEESPDNVFDKFSKILLLSTEEQEKAEKH